MNFYRKTGLIMALFIINNAFAAPSIRLAQAEENFRPPAVPLVAHDPYLSVWSMNDQLTDDWSRHWTGAVQAMCGYVRIDGETLRLLGPQPDSLPAMKQTSLRVLPTRSIYTFESETLAIQLTFMSPLLTDDLDVLSRPMSYAAWEARSKDGRKHDVSIYFDITGEWAVNANRQEVVWSRLKAGGMNVLRLGTEEQPILEKEGDNLRIDWGHVYLAAPTKQSSNLIIHSDKTARESFIQTGALPASDDFQMPRAVSAAWPVLACVFDCGAVSAEPVERVLMIGYDDVYSIEYLERRLRPYWRKRFDRFSDLLQAAAQEYEDVAERCRNFDAELMEDLRRIGGREYACLGALAYRQCLAAHKLAMDFDGTPLHFSKECFSNGCIATVDVTYPASPFFMLFNTELLKGQLRPILEYAQSKRWRFPFAPHDLGRYPLANGQVYGDGEKSEENQMPVEESGNMLIMIAAIAQIEDRADFAGEYWPLLKQWAEYLREQGMDPENQLCTDDFAGHLAHNCNLSIKAIMALGGFAQICEQLGHADEAQEYRSAAQEMAKKWAAMADDGDHYRLAFDKEGTWSQKYNLIWDDLLNLGLFPKEVKRKEIAYYKTVSNSYGLPLDNRSRYTKSDWIVWTASLAENGEDFAFFIKPLYRFLNETPDRVPFTDWYWTHEPKRRGFQARSVVGGVYAPMLYQSELWSKWSKRGMK